MSNNQNDKHNPDAENQNRDISSSFSSPSSPSSPTDKNIRSAKEIKQNLLKRAISEGRGHEMIKLILWRLAEIRHHAAQDEKALAEARYMDGDGQPKSVRALNTLAFHKNSHTRFTLNEDHLTDHYIHPGPHTIN